MEDGGRRERMGIEGEDGERRRRSESMHMQ